MTSVLHCPHSLSQRVYEAGSFVFYREGHEAQGGKLTGLSFRWEQQGWSLTLCVRACTCVCSPACVGWGVGFCHRFLNHFSQKGSGLG